MPFCVSQFFDKYASIRIDNRRADMTSDFGVWVEGVDGLEESIFLVYFILQSSLSLCL
jgi:hypothetical protein